MKTVFIQDEVMARRKVYSHSFTALVSAKGIEKIENMKIQEDVMDDNTNESIKSEINVPEDSVYYKYAEYICYVPGVGAYIPFITTRDALTDRVSRGMIFGTSEKERYEH